MNKFKQKLTGYLKSNGFFATAFTVLLVASVVFVNVIMYTLAAEFGWVYTPEEETDFSISNSGETLFADAIEKGLKVEVIFCMYEDEVKNHDTGSFVYRTAKEYEAKYPNLISLDFINVITMMDSKGDPVDLSVYEKDMRGKETAINKTSIIFRSESSYYVLTDNYTGVGYADFYTLDSEASITSYEGEEVFASMISWVLSDDHGTAYLTTGHGETANISLRYALIRAGYYCDAIADIVNLRAGEVPEDADLVIISNPKTDFERAAEGSSLRSEIERLRGFADRGGHFMVFLDPETKRLPVLEDFIAEFGISVRENEDGERLMVKDSSNAITTDGFTLVAEHNVNSDIASLMKEKIEDLGGRVIIRNVAPLELSGSATPLLLSSPSSVAEAGGETVDSAGSYVIAAYSTRDNQLREDAKMFFVPSIYLTAADAMITNGYSNKDFLYSLFDVYFEKGEMPYGCNSLIFDSGILENLTMGTARWLTAALIAIPVLIAAVGTVVIVRRKNR